MKIWRNLFWKEWHEQKWKLLALTAIALSVCVALLFQDPGNGAFSLLFTIYSYAMFAPIVVGMGVCAGEHASGVIQFVRAQPVPMRRVALVRWIVGGSVLLIPMVCICVIILIVMYFREQVGPQSVRTAASFGSFGPEWSAAATLFVLTVVGMAASLNLYAWIVAVAVNQRTEFRAGLIGLLVTVAIIFSGIGWSIAWDNHLPDISVLSLFGLMSSFSIPLGIMAFIRHSLQWLAVIAVAGQLLLTICLMQVMVFRYGREERWLSSDFFRRTQKAATETMQLGRPRSSQWRALLWLQIRQSLPVCIVGLCLVLTIVVASAGFEADSFDAMFPIVGCVLALLIGVGTFVSELQPALHTFWRSRPISPASWFWFKFIGGAIALFGLFDVPCMLLTWFGIVRTSSPGLVAVFPMLLHLLCYSIAVFMACSVRHSTYSTVLAVGVLSLILVPEMAEFRVPRFLAFFTMWQDATRGATSLASAFQLGHLPFWLTCYDAFLYLSPALILIGAIVIPTTVAAAYLVKRDLSIGS
jgi:hypothetical protein